MACSEAFFAIDSVGIVRFNRLRLVIADTVGDLLRLGVRDELVFVLLDVADVVRVPKLDAGAVGKAHCLVEAVGGQVCVVPVRKGVLFHCLEHAEGYGAAGRGGIGEYTVAAVVYAKGITDEDLVGGEVVHGHGAVGGLDRIDHGLGHWAAVEYVWALDGDCFKRAVQICQ